MAAHVNGRCDSSSVVHDESMMLLQCSMVFSGLDGNVVHPNTRNDTFHEYSPHNSDFVTILTEIGAPTGQNVNKSQNDSQINYNTQPSQDSYGPAPNQDFIAMLDKELNGLPKETYIEKLIDLVIRRTP